MQSLINEELLYHLLGYLGLNAYSKALSFIQTFETQFVTPYRTVFLYEILG